MRNIIDVTLIIYCMFRCFCHVTFGLPDVDYASWDSDHNDHTDPS